MHADADALDAAVTLDAKDCLVSDVNGMLGRDPWGQLPPQMVLLHDDMWIQVMCRVGWLVNKYHYYYYIRISCAYLSASNWGRDGLNGTYYMYEYCT